MLHGGDEGWEVGEENDYHSPGLEKDSNYLWDVSGPGTLDS